MIDVYFNGKSLLDFCDLIEGKHAFDKPNSIYPSYEIPKRNGLLFGERDKISNIQISYRVLIKDNFEERYSELVNYLHSVTSYSRLENSLEPGMYRMALFRSAITSDIKGIYKYSWIEIVFDCKPQEYYADGAEFERIVSHYDTYTGDPAVLINEGDSTVTNLKIALEPIQEMNGFDHPWVGGGGKNMLPTGSFTISGGGTTTATFASDGIHISGTKAQSQWADYLVTHESITLKANISYTFTLQVSNTSVAWSATLRNGNTQLYEVIANNGSGTLTITPTANVTFDRWRLTIRSNDALAVNSVVKPMLRLSSTTATYEPYENICPIYPANGKNYLQITATSQTVNGVTFTVNADGTVKANGTASSAAEFVIKSDVSGNTYAGMILSGCPNGGGGSTYRLFEQVQGSPWTYLASDGGSGVTIPTTTYTTVRFVIRVESGVSVNNLFFKPMIRLASITDSSYQPYQGIMVERTGENVSPVSYPYTLGQNVYGGTVDLATGVLTVTHVYGETTWGAMSDASTVGTMVRKRYSLGTTLSSRAGGTSNIAPYNSVAGDFDVDKGTRWFNDASNTFFYLPPSTPSTTSIQMVAQLATPQTVQLTAQQISLLTGINYISSSGEVTVTTRTPLTLKNPSPMTAKPVFKFTDISAPFTVSANGETIISFQNAIRLVKAGVVNNMFFNATGTNLNIQKQGTPNYEETSFLINSGWLPAGRYFLATMAIGNLQVTSMDGTHLYSSGGTFTLTDMTQVKVWYVITPDASTPQNFNLPIFLRPMGTLYVDSELMDCYMLDGDTAYSFNECVSLPKDFLQLDERTVMTMTSGAVGFIAPNWWRL